MLTRRHLLAAGVAAAPLATVAPAFAQTTLADQAPAARLNALMDAFWSEELETHPEEATELGLDKGDKAALKSRLTDVSAEGMARQRAANARRIDALRSLDRRALSGMDAVNYDTLLYVETTTKPLLDLGIGGFDGFSPSPYVVSPITGAYQRVPVFLDAKHTIATQEDAEAYLSRLSAFAVSLDANTEQMRHDLGRGVTPPDFLLDTTLDQVSALAVPAQTSGLVRSLARRAADHGLGDYAPRASAIYERDVRPALERQIALLRRARAQAGHDAGVWRFADGEAFYRANLRYTTTTDMSPEEVHRMGLEQAAEIGGRLDALLKAQGLTRGTVGERIQGLYKDPAQYFPNTAAGKAELLAYLQTKLAEVKRRLPRDFDRIPHFDIEARAVPAEIDAGAPLAYSESPAIDGSRPGYIYFNLHDTAEWPKWNLPSTLYHEGLPGHQLQGGLALESRDIPIIRRNMYFSGYGEGWALYAEQLADELGMYADDPLGRIGWLKEQIFRAGRCVVDTGIHTMRWSREKAIDYLISLDGDAVGSTRREVDRYCAIPAQACSYKIGHNEWNGQRDKARAALGPRFDIRAFHDAGLLSGAMPLAVLDQVVDAYIARSRG